MTIGTNYNDARAKNSLKDPVWQTSTGPSQATFIFGVALLVYFHLYKGENECGCSQIVTLFICFQVNK